MVGFRLYGSTFPGSVWPPDEQPIDAARGGQTMFALRGGFEHTCGSLETYRHGLIPR
jgi:hypothetical protein